MAPRRLIPLILLGLAIAPGVMAGSGPVRVATLSQLDVNEEVDGDVVAIGGDIVLGPDAVVHGHAVAVLGAVHTQPGAQVDGRSIGLSSLAGVSVQPVPGEDGRHLDAAVRLFAAGGWLFATTLIAFVWPVRVRRGAAVLPQLGLKAVVLGVMVAMTLFACLIAVIGLGPFFGVPLAALVGIVFLAVKGVGLAVLGGGLGCAILRRLAPGRVLPMTASVFVGMIVMLMARFVPVVGGIAWTVLVLFALGAGIFAVTLAPHPVSVTRAGS